MIDRSKACLMCHWFKDTKGRDDFIMCSPKHDELVMMDCLGDLHYEWIYCDVYNKKGNCKFFKLKSGASTTQKKTLWEKIVSFFKG